MDCQGSPSCCCFFKILFIFNLIFFVLGLHCCAGFSLVVASGGYSPVANHRLLTVVASLDAEHGLSGKRASVVAACGLGSCSF